MTTDTVNLRAIADLRPMSAGEAREIRAAADEIDQLRAELERTVRLHDEVDASANARAEAVAEERDRLRIEVTRYERTSVSIEQAVAQAEEINVLRKRVAEMGAALAMDEQDRLNG